MTFAGSWPNAAVTFHTTQDVASDTPLVSIFLEAAHEDYNLFDDFLSVTYMLAQSEYQADIVSLESYFHDGQDEATFEDCSIFIDSLSPALDLPECSEKCKDATNSPGGNPEPPFKAWSVKQCCDSAVDFYKTNVCSVNQDGNSCNCLKSFGNKDRPCRITYGSSNKYLIGGWVGDDDWKTDIPFASLDFLNYGYLTCLQTLNNGSCESPGIRSASHPPATNKAKCIQFTIGGAGCSTNGWDTTSVVDSVQNNNWCGVDVDNECKMSAVDLSSQFVAAHNANVKSIHICILRTWRDSHSNPTTLLH